MHSADPTKFSLHYDQPIQNKKYSFGTSLEVSAISRESRDFLTLALKCFQTVLHWSARTAINSLLNTPS